jgi:ribosomal protein L40E
MRALQAVDLTEKPAAPVSPTGLMFTANQKMVLVVLALALLYLRLFMRRRRRDKVCDHCGHRNPPHQANCAECAAPLFRE